MMGAGELLFFIITSQGRSSPFQKECPGNSRATAIPFFWWTETLSVQFPLRVEGRRKRSLKNFEKCGLQAEESPAFGWFIWNISCKGEDILLKFRALSELTDTDSWSELCTWVCSCQRERGSNEVKRMLNELNTKYKNKNACLQQHKYYNVIFFNCSCEMRMSKHRSLNNK